MDSAASIGGFIIGLIIIVGLFFIFRGLLLWYWKLDKIEEHLSVIRYLAEKNQRENNSTMSEAPISSSGFKKQVNSKTAMKNLEPLKDE